MQDVWNTTPAWGFPYASSALANTPAAAVIDGGIAQQVGGIGIYGYWNHLIYGEISVYGTNRRGITRSLSAGTTPGERQRASFGLCHCGGGKGKKNQPEEC